MTMQQLIALRLNGLIFRTIIPYPYLDARAYKMFTYWENKSNVLCTVVANLVVLRLGFSSLPPSSPSPAILTSEASSSVNSISSVDENFYLYLRQGGKEWRHRSQCCSKHFETVSGTVNVPEWKELLYLNLIIFLYITKSNLSGNFDMNCSN